MADYYSMFSEIIEDLSPEASKWARDVLSLDFVDEPDEILKLLSLTEDSNVDIEDWPCFCWKIESNDSESDAGCSLWLYSSDSFSVEHLTVFVRELINRFMPNYIFHMTSAETCSKPRIGEFGGFWLVISKDEVLYGSTWSAAFEHVYALRECQSPSKKEK